MTTNMTVHNLRAIVLTGALAAVSSTANAEAFNSLGALSQDNFRVLTENLSAATHYRSITPTEPLGILGFDDDSCARILQVVHGLPGRLDH